MKNLSLSSLSLSTIKDVNSSFVNNRSTSILERNEWVYSIDTESMDEVKSFYMDAAKVDGTLSLMIVFNAIAKFSIKNNISF